MENEHKLKIRKKIICILLILFVAFSAIFMAACTREDKTESTDGSENMVRAADPMTEEELEADDTDGCIEDSEDLLY